MKAKQGNTAENLTLELKYCERCGALWLRPTGGKQIYCVDCAREIADLPPTSHEPEAAIVSPVPRWGEDGDKFERYAEEDCGDRYVLGGVA